MSNTNNNAAATISENDWNIAALREARGFLRSQRDLDFALSLLRQHASKGRLSNKQWYWVGKLAEKAMMAAPPTFAMQVLSLF